MTCELHLCSLISDINKLQHFLVGECYDDVSWLRKCIVAVSSCGDRIVFAYKSALVTLTLQWNKEENSSRFVVSRQWEVQNDASLTSDYITAVIVLPLVGIGSQSTGVIDWSCIVVGFSSGYLRFFTENLDILGVSRLHSERVLQIKATSSTKRRDVSGNAEALCVVYPSVICNIPGFSLFQCLRGCRRDVAMKRARSDCSLPTITLDYKKYGFSDAPVLDACVISSTVVNNFDHLQNATIGSGFYSNYRPSPPQQTLIASTGQSAWLQIDYSIEGVTAPLELTDVALTVISKLPGWLGISTGKSSEPTTRSTEKLHPRCRLLDRRREGKTIVCSPDECLIVVSDSLGRVTLVEARTGIAIRLWKGYRDAECGFLEVEDDKPKKRHKHRHRHSSGGESSAAAAEHPGKVLLLVIYVPKKGLIELFPLRHGPRVAAIRVSRNGRLVYTPHGLMGFSEPTASRKTSVSSSHLVFISEDGVMELVIPYHCARLDTSARAKDIHFLKQLKTTLKENSLEEDDLVSTVTALVIKLQTDEVRLLALDVLTALDSVSPRIYNAVIDAMLVVAKDTDTEVHAGDMRNLMSVCKHYRKVIKFYGALRDIPALDIEASATLPADEAKASLTEVLLLSELELSRLLDLIKKNESSVKRKRDGRVSFFISSKPSLSRLLKSLDFTDDGPLLPSSKLSEEDFLALGHLFYSRVEKNIEEITTWRNEAQLSNISGYLFARCLIVYWLHRPMENLEHDVRILICLLKNVCSLSEDGVTSRDYNIESCWWTELRSVITHSQNTLVAMITCVCCRAVSITCEQETELTRCDNPKDKVYQREWETVSADTWQWHSLISHLEDVTVLNMVLLTSPGDRLRSELSPVSLHELQTSGESAAADLVARWLCQFNLPPNLLLDKSDVEFQTTPDASQSEPFQEKTLFKVDDRLVFPLIEVGEDVQAETNSDPHSIVLDKVKLLKRRFPFSLTSSALLSHVGWELMSKWKQDVSNIAVLNSAVHCFQTIPSAQLRTGVCSLAWSTYMKGHLEEITRLISRMGKLPTDTLCVREVGIPRSMIPELLQIGQHLLSILMDASSERPVVAFVTRPDALWPERSNSSSTSIINVALSRIAPYEQVVLLHIQITKVMHMVASLEIKDKAVLSTLYESLKSDLFGELSGRRAVALHHPGMSDALLSFLRRAVSAAVQTVREVEGGDSVQLDGRQSSHWLRICLDLASTWRLPLDSLRRHYVCELYSSGYDRLAEEVVSGVNDTALLASQLLVVIGKRIKSAVESSANPQQLIANLSPNLTAWLNSLDKENVREYRATLEDSEILMNYVLQHLPEHNIDSNLATLMAECLPGLLIPEQQISHET